MHLLVVKVQTRDYKQDYVLTHHCKDEVKDRFFLLDLIVDFLFWFSLAGSSV